MLEDDFTYVLRKALTGRQLSPEEAAARAGLSESAVMSFMEGSFDPRTARKLAVVLGLNADAFAGHDRYHPAPLSIPEVRRLDLPFGGERVNAWLVRKDGMVVMFDAGYDAHDLLRALGEASPGCTPDRLFVTHTHRDHVGGLEKLKAQGVQVHAADIPGTILMEPGDERVCGPLRIRACDLSGHALPSLGFHVEGLEHPVLVTGDAVFAGSIGGCASKEAFQHALERIHEVTGGLPDETILLPGHGPATTLGEERRANPFL
jgi:glyoxylase-like metal-dependent hydrolase (beta-lactamase superfamily II)